MSGKRIIVSFLTKIGFFIVCLSLLPWYHSAANTAIADSLQKQFAGLKGADKITLLAKVAGKGLPRDPSFLKAGIKSLVSNPTLLKEKGSLDALYRLVKALSENQAVGLVRPLIYAGAGAALEQGDYERAFLFELAFSDLFFDLNEADSATVYLSKASEIVYANSLNSQEHLLMNRRARIAELQGRKLEALDLYLQAARLYQAQNKQTELAIIYDNIGTLHIGLHNLAEAVKFLKMANAINQKPGLEKQCNSTYINLGIAYKEYDSLKQAEFWYKKSIALSRQLNDEFQLARVYLNLGNTERRVNNYAQAKILYDSSLYFCRKLNNNYGVLLNTINLGEWRLLRKEYTAALEQLKTAEKELKNYKLPVETEEVSRLLSAVYEATGDDHAALKYFKTYSILKDSIEGAETKRSILELQARYEQERSAKEIASLNEAVMKGKASKRLYIIVLIIIIMALTTVGTYL